jgi:hypoxanthine phosphoribosyltransferase
MTDSPATTPRELLEKSELIYSAEDIDAALDKLAQQITAQLHDTCPLVLSVMGGAVVFSGQLLPRLHFPLEFDYVQASRYHNQTSGQKLVWKVQPGNNVQNRTVLVLDDILDEGHTLAAIKQKCLEQGATRVVIAVMTDKRLDHEKPIYADFVGFTVPDRYVFGYGMDVYGWWRNLPAIYAFKGQ